MPKHDTQEQPKRSLVARLAWGITLLIAGIVMVSSVLEIYTAVQTERAFLATKQSLIASGAATEVKSFVDTRITELATAAAAEDLSSADKGTRGAVLGTLLHIEPAFRQVIVLHDGNETDRVSRLSTELSKQLIRYDPQQVYQAVQSGRTYVGPVYIDGETGEPAMVIAVPIPARQGGVQGVLVAEMSLRYMWDVIDSIKVGDAGDAYVVDNTGGLIAYRDTARVLKGENLRGVVSEVDMMLEESGTQHDDTGGSSAGISRGIDGTWVVDNHAYIGTPDWSVIVEQPAWQAYRPIVISVAWTLVIVILCLAFSFTLALGVARRTAEPINQLSETAQEIAAGDFSKRAAVESDDEIGRLAQSFNTMTKTLIATRQLPENILRSMKDSLFVTDSNGIITEVNSAALEVLGYSKQELIGSPIRNVLHMPVISPGASLSSARQEPVRYVPDPAQAQPAMPASTDAPVQ